MSQLENWMLLGLGFSLAVLVALVVGKLAWNLAVRLGRRRRIQDQPAELLDLQADRDRLRAEYAVLSRKLELKLDDLKARLVEQMAEVSRNRNRILTLIEDMKARDAALEVKTEEARRLGERNSALEADLRSRIAELETARQAADGNGEALAEAQDQLKSLNQALSGRERQIGAFRAALVKDQTPPLPPMDEETGSAEERLKRRIAELSDLSEDIAAQRLALKSERDALGSARPAMPRLDPAAPRSLDQRLDAAMRDADDLAEELLRLDALWSGAAGSTDGDAQPAPPPAVETEKPQRGGVANVISLAQRIRALKNDLKSS